jgi:hypothetical protein
MKKSEIPMAQAEKTRAALDAIEGAFGRVRTGLRAGEPPAHAAAWDNANGQPFQPQVIALYGVVVAS